jgi:hypothetical protein
VLPVHCLNQLLMSLPRMIQAALQRSHADPSLRLVHPMPRFGAERGECDAAGLLQYILTLETAAGFAVSFPATEGRLAELANAVVDDVVGVEPVSAVAYLNY